MMPVTSTSTEGGMMSKAVEHASTIADGLATLALVVILSKN
jgi:hypothetical protein